MTRPPYISVFFISASILIYEILLIRLYAIVQWHHYGYMVISMALLGFSMAGVVVSFLKSSKFSRYKGLYILLIVIYSLSSVICFEIAQSINFNPYEMLWDVNQGLMLFFQFILLLIPFVLAASVICMAISLYLDKASYVYACDLFGAGVGAFVVLVLLSYFKPDDVLFINTGFILAVALIAILETQCARCYQYILLVVVSVVFVVFKYQGFELNVSEFKAKQQLESLYGAKEIYRKSNAMSVISVLENNEVPFRFMPGSSLVSAIEPLPQLAVFWDEDNMSVITRYPDDLDDLEYLAQTTMSLAYHIGSVDSLLILGSGTGYDLLLGKYYDVKTIDAVEINPLVVDMLKNEFLEYSGGLYSAQGVNVEISDARAYVKRSAKQYDMISLSMIDGYGASVSGVYALNENYLYTKEAIADYVNDLNENGYLSITRWLKLPPRDSLRILVTAVQALEKMGFDNAADHLVMIRGWKSVSILIKKSAFTEEEITQLKAFCDKNFFDTVYFPGITLADANRFNVLDSADFYRGVQELLFGRADEFMRDYLFEIKPVTDDRPYFYHFFKWGAFKEIIKLKSRGGLVLIEWGYLILLASLIVTLVLGIMFMLASLLLVRLRGKNKVQAEYSQVSGSGASGATVFLYFWLVGMAFMFVEMAFIQKFMQFLHHPSYSVAVVVCSFLVFASMGSAFFSGRNRFLTLEMSLVDRGRLAIKGIAIVSLLYLLFANYIFDLFSGFGVYCRFAISVILIAPLGFFMGVPFPVGINLFIKDSRMVPWVWSINGAASVVSAVLAIVVAMQYGFSFVLAVSVVLYLSALLILNLNRRYAHLSDAVNKR